VIAVVTVVLVTLGAANDELVATVNGEGITAGDVAQMQARYEFYYGEQYSFEEALERLVVEALVYREARRAGYLPDMEQAKQELGAQLIRDGWTMQELLAALEESGIVYDDYMETFRKELAIRNYVDDEVAVTTGQARDRYDYLVETYEGEVPPFDSVKEQIIAEMESENLVRLIERLMADATIEILVEDN
jgi:parvulin-like peptidyl-prolyl isomerase